MVPFPSKITLVLYEEHSAVPFSGASGNAPSIQGWTSVTRWQSLSRRDGFFGAPEIQAALERV